MPKRFNNLYDQVCNIENLELALDNASRGRKEFPAVKRVLLNRESLIAELQKILVNEEFKNGPYRVFELLTREGKLRDIYALPFYPDRIVHHAIVQVCSPIWIKSFIRNTYACIPGRGIHDAVDHIRQVMPSLKNYYILKCDIKKYFPSIRHDTLKDIIKRKIKDKRLLNLIFEIIDSAPGLPVGNYLSQYLGNLMLTPFDHWIKEEKRIKLYYRYCDDFVLIHCNKDVLHTLRIEIETKLYEMGLQLKSNWQVYPVSEGLDFVGYRFWPDRTILRKKTIKNYKSRIKPTCCSQKCLMQVKHYVGSFKGWLKYCDCRVQRPYLLNSN